MKKYLDLKPYGSNQQIRKDYYTCESVQHPAKMDISLTRWILDHYVKNGDTVLDCMAGIGTTLIEGMRMFPDCIFIGVEFEQKFVDMAQANIKKVQEIYERDLLKPKLGKAIVMRGDARSLEGIAEKIITSPPYAEALSGGGLLKQECFSKYVYSKKLHSTDKNNIGNLKYGKIDKIVSSPPYSDTYKKNKVNTPEEKERRKERLRKVGIDYDKWKGGGNLEYQQQYSEDKDNIGNMKDKTYLSEIFRVYQQCYNVLVPDGLLILVVKSFIRKGKIVDLPLDTIKLCEMAGFKHIATHYRKIEHPSFWRILHKKKYPSVDPEERVNEEDILVFKKKGELF